jgi:hypothetical protein
LGLETRTTSLKKLFILNNEFRISTHIN